MIVEISGTAYADLTSLSEYIEAEAGAAIADAYDARVREKISTLSAFPNRGTDRSLLGAGYRSITFERRLLILYRVSGDFVTVVRVLSAERDLRDIRL